MTDALTARRESILESVREFADVSLAAREFVPGESTVPVSGKVLDADDMVALVDSSLDGWLTAGRCDDRVPGHAGRLRRHPRRLLRQQRLVARTSSRSPR